MKFYVRDLFMTKQSPPLEDACISPFWKTIRVRDTENHVQADGNLGGKCNFLFPEEQVSYGHCSSRRFTVFTVFFFTVFLYLPIC